MSCGRLLRCVAAEGSGPGAEIQWYLDDRRPGELSVQNPNRVLMFCDPTQSCRVLMGRSFQFQTPWCCGFWRTVWAGWTAAAEDGFCTAFPATCSRPGTCRSPGTGPIGVQPEPGAAELLWTYHRIQFWFCLFIWTQTQKFCRIYQENQSFQTDQNQNL